MLLNIENKVKPMTLIKMNFRAHAQGRNPAPKSECGHVYSLSPEYHKQISKKDSLLQCSFAGQVSYVREQDPEKQDPQVDLSPEFVELQTKIHNLKLLARSNAGQLDSGGDTVIPQPDLLPEDVEEIERLTQMLTPKAI